MEKARTKRRGIALGGRADGASVLDRLTVQLVRPGTTSSDPARPTPGIAGLSEGSVAPMSALLDELRRLHAGLVGRCRQHTEQIERPLTDLEQRRDQIARQTPALQALEQCRAASGLVDSLLALAGVAALGFHGWPWLRGVEEDFNRLSAGVAALAPKLQAVHEQVIVPGSNGAMGNRAIASLQEDVEGASSDLGSLRRAVDTLSEAQSALAASTGGSRSSANARPHNATTMTNPYRTAAPLVPW